MNDQPIQFSDEVIKVYRQLQANGDDPRVRQSLMIDLATQFANDVDRTDTMLIEPFHTLIDELDKAQLAYDQASFRVARALLRDISLQLAAAKPAASEAKPHGN